jgi:hypothetical protein
MHMNMGSTGVYIGQLEPPHKPIEEDADDDAHLDTNSPPIIKFKFSNEDHKDLIVGTSLAPGQGISHDVFSADVTTKNEALDLDGKSSDEVLNLFNHKYVPEVVRNPKMHYWKVPRLGSYLAIPMVYQSCLSVESFT